MKKLIYLILFSGVILFSSCQKDIISPNVPENYVGTWFVSEKNKTSSKITKYEVTISLSSQEDEILVNNFANLGKDTQATLRVFEFVVVLKDQDIDGFTIEATTNGKAKSDYSQFDLTYKLEGDTFEANFKKN